MVGTDGLSVQAVEGAGNMRREGRLAPMTGRGRPGTGHCGPGTVLTVLWSRDWSRPSREAGACGPLRLPTPLPFLFQAFPGRGQGLPLTILSLGSRHLAHPRTRRDDTHSSREKANPATAPVTIREETTCVVFMMWPLPSLASCFPLSPSPTHSASTSLASLMCPQHVQ